MNVKDINRWLQPPKGYALQDVRADGSFLRLEYQQMLRWGLGNEWHATAIQIIYLNDMGREVLRTVNIVDRPKTDEPKPKPPMKWWQRAIVHVLWWLLEH